ncbi:uncharacterized protein LOC108098609 [Drosophila ficusphila]|uniref:uncharacterized protein LOC108098609 n=1 Tax=Drosophila ficusphila TaxID=30025 RepID=UPI0007E73D95|nr:uncharacterized protein LOC108098609 [Drosophila ficusphila]
MKLQFALSALIVVLCSLGFAQAYEGNGEPGCKTQAEIDIAVFRNNWDATSYWKCESLNQPASEMKCPSETGFMDSLKNCVSWEEWEWEKPLPPISEADQ